MQYTVRKYQAPPNPFQRGRSIVNPFRRHSQPVYEPHLEKVWEESLDKKQVELMCKGILDDIVSEAMHEAEGRTKSLFSQLDTPVREWVLGQDIPAQMQVQVQVQQSPRPVTPTIRSPKAGESWSLVSTLDRSTLIGTPSGTPVRGPGVGHSPLSPRARPSPKTPVRGITIDVYGGILEEQSGLIPTYLNRTPVQDLQTEEEQREDIPEVMAVSESVPPLHRTVSEETIILNPEEEEAAHESSESTKADTSAKESTSGSPRVPKQRKRKSSSERSVMTITSENVEEEGEPVFKTWRRDILQGKDIGNRAQKSKGRKVTAATGFSEQLEQAGTIEDTLNEVFVAPLTQKTSLYKQYHEEQKALRRDALNPKYGGKGRGKGGRKRKSAMLNYEKDPWDDPYGRLARQECCEGFGRGCPARSH